MAARSMPLTMRSTLEDMLKRYKPHPLLDPYRHITQSDFDARREEGWGASEVAKLLSKIDPLHSDDENMEVVLGRKIVC